MAHTPQSTDQGHWERRFERWLWSSRFLVLFAVIPSLAGVLYLMHLAQKH
jgi:uncharacterized membrane protein YqhA